ncbi:MAG: aldose 1-epimerase [Candidatus Latescibacteria bacterium]|nr:aldose 1-epimerase [Candidatus Latescibacterota bacterium]
MRLYTPERNHGCRITEVIYRGLQTVILENELLRVTILADKGTDIVEFLHKPTDTDFLLRLWQGVRDPRRMVLTSVPENGTFLDYYSGGWQDILPNLGNACTHRGAHFGLHGEVSLIPWDYEVVRDDAEEIAVRFRVKTYRTPFSVEKTLSMRSGRAVLDIHEKITNESPQTVDLMWGNHPTFGPPFLEEGCVIDLPKCRVKTAEYQVDASSRLAMGQDTTWPFVKSVDGSKIDLRNVPSAKAKCLDLAFPYDYREGWYALTNPKRQVGFGMQWDAKVFPYITFWHTYGGGADYPWYGRLYCLALEPWSSYPPVLTEAVERKAQIQLGPHKSIETEFRAVAYAGAKRVRRITPDGKVIPA